MQFFIIVPVKNGTEYLNRSLGSLLLQEGEFDLHVHVQDGDSDDSPERILDRWNTWLSAGTNKNIRLTFSRQSDRSIYEGINRAFDKFSPSDDTVMTWLGADDILMPGTLATVQSILLDCPEIKWLTGASTVAGYDGSNSTPWPTQHFTRYHLSRGHHDGRTLEFVMEEGTFWRVSLWRMAGGVNANYRRASDSFLWMKFANFEQLYAVDFPLGRYSFRQGQLAEDKIEYYRELDEMKKDSSLPPIDDLRSFTVNRYYGMPKWQIQEHVRSEPLYESTA